MGCLECIHLLSGLYIFKIYNDINNYILLRDPKSRRRLLSLHKVAVWLIIACSALRNVYIMKYIFNLCIRINFFMDGDLYNACFSMNLYYTQLYYKYNNSGGNYSVDKSRHLVIFILWNLQKIISESFLWLKLLSRLYLLKSTNI